ncbi:hypothetical protein H632_c152p1 [Helicosporidium sp. ATCC 50920]|nr:hypothetical protein H632_c152p1 [Helicosporidium sp. ATCC 50920]|eukprot:KDD76637.1 hypothetical protein H632_c152p1 [Helicosporidium sp. ATCC 50920]
MAAQSDRPAEIKTPSPPPIIYPSRALPHPPFPPAPHEVLETSERSPSSDAAEIYASFPHLAARRRRAVSVTRAAEPPPPAPLRVGVLFSGGQAPGGHNVIAGLLDYLESRNPSLEGTEVVGFLGGPRGLVTGECRVLSRAAIAPYRNQGGFHLIGSGRNRLESRGDLEAAAASVTRLALDALVIVGGDDSNTTAAVLAEHFLKTGVRCGVLGVPKTIDGDLKSADVPVSFGFDSACKVYAELVGNVALDAASSQKYYHFVRLMGRHASHVTLECALQTRPQLALISEEGAAQNWALADVVHAIASMVRLRAARGRHHGVVLVPEGLVEHLSDVSALLEDLNRARPGGEGSRREESPGEDRCQTSANSSSARLPVDEHGVSLSWLRPEARRVYSLLDARLRSELLEERDPHGNVQVAHIETEKLLARLVARELARPGSVAPAGSPAGGPQRGTSSFSHLMGAGGAAHAAGPGQPAPHLAAPASPTPVRFSAVSHYFGYEGRCSLPTNFDATYCSALGAAAGALAAAGATGLMVCVSDLARAPAEWTVGGTPLLGMMHMSVRAGERRPVVAKVPVDLMGGPFRAYAAARSDWARHDRYRCPGPIQFRGHDAADVATMTLALELNGGRPISLV